MMQQWNLMPERRNRILTDVTEICRLLRLA